MSTIKSDNSDLTINASGTSKDIKFQADGTERMVLKSDGNVGIGTNSPDNTTYFGSVVHVAGQSNAGIMFERTANAAKWSVGTHSSGDMVVVNGGTEKARFSSSGGITFNGDTATANALDDYEEGTWTPVPTNCTGTATDTNYTKIGDTVHIWGRFSFATASGEISLSGIPYTPANNQVGGSIMLTGANIGGGSTYNVIIYFTTTPRILIYTSEDNSSWSTLSNSHIGNGDGIIFNGFYKV